MILRRGMMGGGGEGGRERNTRRQTLQLSSLICSVERGGLVSVSVTAPQWQPPFISPFEDMDSGSELEIGGVVEGSGW